MCVMGQGAVMGASSGVLGGLLGAAGGGVVGGIAGLVGAYGAETAFDIGAEALAKVTLETASEIARETGENESRFVNNVSNALEFGGEVLSFFGAAGAGVGLKHVGRTVEGRFGGSGGSQPIEITSNKITWIDENASMNPNARLYNDSVTGARSNAQTMKGQAPSLKYFIDNKEKIVRFDGVENSIMIDRKISIVTTEKSKNQAFRQSLALQQNNLTGRWEVPNIMQKLRAEKLLEELKITNIEVKVVNVPNSQ